MVQPDAAIQYFQPTFYLSIVGANSHCSHAAVK